MKQFLTHVFDTTDFILIIMVRTRSGTSFLQPKESNRQMKKKRRKIRNKAGMSYLLCNILYIVLNFKLSFF